MAFCTDTGTSLALPLPMPTRPSPSPTTVNVAAPPAPNVTVNAQASKGFRLGGVNDPLNLPLCNAQDAALFGGFQDYDDESLWNYEVGVKSGGRGFTFNAAGFYNDIKNLQVTLDAGTCSSRIVCGR